MSSSLQLRPSDREYVLSLRQSFLLPGNSAAGVGEPLLWTSLLLSGRSRWSPESSSKLLARHEMETLDRIGGTLYGTTLSSITDEVVDNVSPAAWTAFISKAREIGSHDAKSSWIRLSTETPLAPDTTKACYAIRSILDNSTSTAYRQSPPSRLSRAYWEGAAPHLTEVALERIISGQAKQERSALSEVVGALSTRDLDSYQESLRERAYERSQSWLKSGKRPSDVVEMDTLTAAHQFLVVSSLIEERRAALDEQTLSERSVQNGQTLGDLEEKQYGSVPATSSPETIATTAPSPRRNAANRRN